MPLPPGWRFLKPEEAALEIKAGNSDVKNTVIRDADQAVANVNELPVVADNSNILTKGAGLAARQIIGHIPAAIGGRIAGTALGMLTGAGISSVLGAPVAEGGGIIPAAGTALGGLAGMLGGGIATQYGQDWVLNKLANKNPQGKIADFLRASERDQREYPYASMIASLGTAPFGGGGLGTGGAKNALKMATLQTGIEGGSQIYHGDFDPGRLAIAGVGGAVTGNPSRRVRAFERRVLPEGAFKEHFAPAMEPPTTALNRSAIEQDAIANGANIEAVDKARMPLQLQSDFNPDYFVAAPVEELSKLPTPFAKEVVRIKKALAKTADHPEIPLTADDIVKVASAGERNFKSAANDLLLDKFQQVRGLKPASPEITAAAATNIPGKAAAESASVIKANAQATAEAEAQRLTSGNTVNAAQLAEQAQSQGRQQAVAGITAGENAPVKSAAESAEIIAGRSKEVGDVNKEIKAFRSLEKQRDQLMKLIDQSPELTNDPGVRDLMMNFDKNILARRNDLLRRGQEKLLYGEVEPAPAKLPVGEEASPIEITRTTSPESIAAAEATTNPLEIPTQVKPIIPSSPARPTEPVVRIPTEPPPIPQSLPTRATQAEAEAVMRAAGIEPPIKKKEVSEASPSPQALGITPQGVLKESLQAIHKAVRPGLERIASSLGKVGERFKKRYEEMRVTSRQLTEPYHDAINKMSSGLSGKDIDVIDNFLEERYNTGKSSIALTPEQSAAVKQIDEIERLLGVERSRSDTPLIRDATTGLLRPFVPKPNFFYQTPSKEFWKVRTEGPSNPKYKQFQKLFMDYQAKYRGITDPDELLKMWNAFTPIGAATAKGQPSTMFAQLREAEGIGLPKELRMNWLEGLRRQATKQGLDLGYHRAIESDPELGPLMGHTSDARGNAFPQVDQILANNPDVQAAMKDYIGAIDPAVQKWETVERGVKSGIVQTMTQVWNITQTLAPLGERFRLRDAPGVFKGVISALSPKATNEAIARGSVRAGRNVSPAASEDVGGFLNKAWDFINNITLTEPLEKVHRTFFDVASKELVTKRLNEGDTKFFNELGPENWTTWSKPKLIDYVTARMVERMAGSYSAEGLPNFALRGSNSYLKPFIGLARWGIERSNRWIDDVYKPATRGDIAPLLYSMTGGLLSATAVNYLKEQLTNKKPREVSWEEYLKLPEGNKDLAYTLLSKANTAGYAGIFGSIAFNMLAARKGETPYGFQNPLIGAATETIERINQFSNAVSNGDTTFAEGLPQLIKVLAQDRIQLARTLMERKDVNSGAREEKIARRVGYLPPSTLDIGGHLTNPFGQAGAIRDENTTALNAILTNKMNRRQEINAPQATVRHPNYYQFIEMTQGKEAANNAKQRDINESIRRRDVFIQSLPGR